jgi:hypothetical protein
MDKIAYCTSSESEEETAPAKVMPSIARTLDDIPNEFSTKQDVRPVLKPKESADQYRFTEPPPLIVPTFIG